MNNSIELKMSEAVKGRSLKYKLIAIMLVVSLIVVPSVFWWLKLTGITMAGDAFCGITEHVHSDECMQKTLVCNALQITEEELTHEFSEPMEQSSVELTEIPSETVSDEALSEEQNSEPVSESVHIHTDECYEVIYTCNLDEHIHDATCYSDNTADVETEKDWTASLSSVVLTGNYHTDLVAVAKTQLGYTESTANFILGEDGTRRGYTRYGEWYGAPYAKWSATFISFCLNYADISNEIAPYNSGAQTMLEAWNGKGIYFSAADYSPVCGDIAFFDFDLDSNCDYAGIISAYDSEKITVIYGGETTVKEVDFVLSDNRLTGFGSLTEAVKQSLSDEDIARIENTKAQIASLPTQEEVEAQISQMDSESDEFTEWYQSFSLRVLTVYAYYEDLGPSLQPFAGNTEKLDNLAWAWQAVELPVATISTLSVYQSNQYKSAVTTIVYGGSVRSIMGAGMSYTYWDVVVVDKNSSGFYVSLINTNDVSKLDVAPSTSEGFVILLYNNTSAISGVEVGNQVTVSPANFYTSKNTSTSPIGTVTFSTAPLPGEDNIEANKNKLTIIQGADTRELIEVNLYDYTTNINDLYNSSAHVYPGFQQDGGTKSIGTSIGRFSMNFGNNITKDLGTLISNVTSNSPGEINKTTNAANGSLQGVMSPTLVNGYPAMADGKSLDYLFKTNTYATKVNTQSINGLFLYDDVTGAYHFNSRENHAQYNASNDTFTLYDQIITSNFIMYPFGNFLPFNDILSQTTQTTTINRSWFNSVASSAQTKYNNGAGSEYSTLSTVLTKFVSLMDGEYGTGWNYRTAINKYFTLNSLTFPQDDNYLSRVYSIDYDEPTDFFFGMDMHMEFIQPKGGLTGKDGNQEMVFDFTGDDDVWVYVDDKLFLELSGIHRHVGGKIDFVRGTVEYCDLNPATGDIGAPIKTVTFAQILGSTDQLNANGTFKDYTNHTMDFYYMERGAGSGVCRMNFNLPLIHKNNISVSKQLTTDQEVLDMLGNPDFDFQVLKENGTDLFISPGTEYTIYDENGNDIGTGITNENGIFSLKAGQTATFGNIFDDGGDNYFVRELLDESVFEQFGTISVDGAAITEDSVENVQISGENFKGVDSPIKNVDEGSTSFLFNNNLDPNKLGSLQIKKTLLENTPATFNFEITLDGVLLEEGTKYIVTDSSGVERNETVTTAGIISIASGETALLPKVIAGSVYTVKELGAEENDYTVFYRGDGVEVVNGSATGTVDASTNVNISVINTKKGTYIEIPFAKTLKNPDSSGHEYVFKLVETTDISGAVIKQNGINMEQKLFVTDSASGSLMIPFALADMVGSEEIHYLKLYEHKGETDFTTVYDETFYVFAVKVTKDSDNKLSAELIEVRKNGQYAMDLTAVSTFANQNVRSLYITKSVEGNSIESAEETQFRFVLLLSHNDVPLTGTYTVHKGAIISQITFNDGIAEIYLKDGETAQIKNLPYGTHWTVTEASVEGFYTSNQVDSGEIRTGTTASGLLENDSNVLYINRTGYILPETGDYATLIYTFGAAMVILAPLVYGYKLHRRNRKRAER